MSTEGKLTDDQVVNAAMEAITKLVSAMPTTADKANAVGMLLLVSYKLMRTLEDDEFVIGWLESALHEVRTQPVDVVLRTVQ